MRIRATGQDGSRPKLRIWLVSGGAVLVLGLSGCQAVNPGVAQLEEMKKRDLQANAAAAVACAPSAPECYQLHLLKGDACYALAAKVVGAERRADYACAATALAAGIAEAPTEQTPVGAVNLYARKRLESLRGLIDTRGLFDPPGDDALAQAATEFLQRYKDDPAGPFYLASAKLTGAQDRFFANQNKAALCASLPAIDQLQREGARAPGDFQENYVALAADLDGMRRVGGCS